MKTIAAERLTPENVELFGKAIKIDGPSIMDMQEDAKYWGPLAIMSCEESMQIGIHTGKNIDFVVSKLEHHAETPELLVALKGDFITPVTISVEKDGKLVPDLTKLKIIRVNQGESILFNEGVWHWSPYPVGDSCEVLVVFKKDTPDKDFISYELKEKIKMLP